jgi:hypothetical protein
MGERTGKLFRIEGIMTKERYHSILQHHAIPSELRLGGKGFKHASKLCSKYLESKEQDGILDLFEWPSQALT